MRDPLWLDELHTSWCIAGDWSEVADRAQAGNQTPLFFWLEKALATTLGKLAKPLPESPAFQSPWELRAVSWVSFVGCSLLTTWILCRFKFDSDGRTPVEENAKPGKFTDSLIDVITVLAIVSLWLGWDRIQHFYASEARVYSLLQFLELACWISIACACRCSHQRRGKLVGGELIGGTQLRILVLWAGLAVLSLAFHLVAVLPVATQCLFLVSWLGFKYRTGHPRESAEHISENKGTRNPSRLRWGLGILLVIVAVLAGLKLLAPVVTQVWLRRQQWADFAGDSSWTTIAGLFPVRELLGTVLVLWIVDRVIKVFLMSKVHTRKRAAWDGTGCYVLLWSVAFAGPIVMAWAMTWFEVAPLMHRRYLLCCSIPLVVLSALIMMSMNSRLLRVVAVVVAFGVLGNSQGTFDIWLRGQLVSRQRNEDWQSAVIYLSQINEPGDRLWVASGLIEAEGVVPPLTPEQDRYLSFPLRGLYQVYGVQAQQEPVAMVPHALVTDSGLWLEQWLSEQKAVGHLLVCRSDIRVLTSILNVFESYLLENDVRTTTGDRLGLQISHPPQGFGGVCAARVEWVLRTE